MNCDQFAVVSNGEYSLHVFATMEKKRPAENNEPFLSDCGIMSLYHSNALTGQVDALVAEIFRVSPLQNGSVFDWQSLIVNVVDNEVISDHCRVVESLVEFVNSLTCKNHKKQL